MNDSAIRHHLKSKTLARFLCDPNSRVVDELGLRHGAGRVDVAVINDLIHGYEIKGETDTLNRLPTQVRVYNSVLDRVTLVVANKHLEEALHLIPEWWGAINATRNHFGKLSFKILRKGKRNPDIVPLSVARLLWRDEALQELERLGLSDGIKSKNRTRIYQKLVDEMTLTELRRLVRSQLLHRKNWRSVG